MAILIDTNADFERTVKQFKRDLAYLVEKGHNSPLQDSDFVGNAGESILASGNTPIGDFLRLYTNAHRTNAFDVLAFMAFMKEARSLHDLHHCGWAEDTIHKKRKRKDFSPDAECRKKIKSFAACLFDHQSVEQLPSKQPDINYATYRVLQLPHSSPRTPLPGITSNEKCCVRYTEAERIMGTRNMVVNKARIPPQPESGQSTDIGDSDTINLSALPMGNTLQVNMPPTEEVEQITDGPDMFANRPVVPPMRKLKRTIDLPSPTLDLEQSMGIGDTATINLPTPPVMPLMSPIRELKRSTPIGDMAKMTLSVPTGVPNMGLNTSLVPPTNFELRQPARSIGTTACTIPESHDLDVQKHNACQNENHVPSRPIPFPNCSTGDDVMDTARERSTMLYSQQEHSGDNKEESELKALATPTGYVFTPGCAFCVKRGLNCRVAYRGKSCYNCRSRKIKCVAGDYARMELKDIAPSEKINPDIIMQEFSPNTSRENPNQNVFMSTFRVWDRKRPSTTIRRHLTRTETVQLSHFSGVIDRVGHLESHMLALNRYWDMPSDEKDTTGTEIHPRINDRLTDIEMGIERFEGRLGGRRSAPRFVKASHPL